jgi:hypothetical protein
MVRRLRRLAVLTVLAAACLLAAQTVAAAAAPRIILRTPHAWQVVQRGRDDRADLVVTGRLVGLGGAVRVAWGAARATARCDAAGRFVARLEGVPAGQADLEVRSARRPGVVCRRESVGVGDVYVIAGQSNASGRSRTLFAYTSEALRATMFGNDDRWRDLRDPVDAADGQVDSVSRDFIAAGSVWPVVATVLLAQEGVPVAFVPCARSSTSIARWQPGLPERRPAGTLYSSMARRVAAVGGRIRAVLFWQGERDARYRTGAEAYEAGLERLAAAVWRDFSSPLLVAQTGNLGADLVDADVDGIRLAQQCAWREQHIVQGPVLYDIDLEGETHFVQPDDVELAAHRWAAAILGGVLGRDAGRTPRLVGAAYDEGDGAGDAGEVVLTADTVIADGVGVEGFVVSSGDREVPLLSAGVEGQTVRLVLGEPVTGPLTVSLGAGGSAAGASVPTDTSAWRLPMLPFVHLPVTTDGR